MFICRAQTIYKITIAIGIIFPIILSRLLAQDFLYLDVNNDFLNYKGQGTDKYYTAGITLGGLIQVKQKKSDYLTISFSEKIFTASNIVLNPEEIHPTDYPYAGLIYISMGYQYVSPNNTFYTKGEFSWGTTGPSSGANMIQRELHKIIGDREPNGWSTQVELGNFIQAQFEHTRSIIKSSWMKINCVGNIHLGSIFNNLSLATELKIDKSNNPFIGHASKLMQPFSKPHLSLWARPKIAYILSNRLLQTNQNQFGLHPRIINKIVYYSSIGINLQFNKISISVIQHYNTPEFKTATKHAFGEIAFQLNI
jgi:hypothetical protein